MNIHDIAKYILTKRGTMTAMKLQKLIYYSQAWSLVWDDKALFDERIEAWANGPVAPDVYSIHRGQFEVTHWPIGNIGNLDPLAKETVDAVLEFYGDKSGQWLSDLTHREKPWAEARSGLAPGERGSREISKAAMAEYYSSLEPNNAQKA